MRAFAQTHVCCSILILYMGVWHQLSEAVECYQLALAINPLFPSYVSCQERQRLRGLISRVVGNSSSFNLVICLACELFFCSFDLVLQMRLCVFCSTWYNLGWCAMESGMRSVFSVPLPFLCTLCFYTRAFFNLSLPVCCLAASQTCMKLLRQRSVAL